MLLPQPGDISKSNAHTVYKNHYILNHYFSMKSTDYIEISTESGAKPLSGYAMVILRGTQDRKEVTIEVILFKYSELMTL